MMKLGLFALKGSKNEVVRHLSNTAPNSVLQDHGGGYYDRYQ